MNKNRIGRQRLKMKIKQSQEFKIGNILIKPKHNQIIKEGKTILLEPLAMAMLLLLAEQQGNVIGSDELFKKLWQGKVVSDNALHRIVRQLRKALDDKAADPQYIRTVKKSGYVLISEVKRSQSLISTGYPISKLTLFTASLFVLVIAGYYWASQDSAPHQLQDIQQLTNLPGFERDPIYWPQKKSVIFTHQPNGVLFNNIAVRSIESAEFRYLTDDYLHYSNLTLSHDGRYLAYVLRDDHKCSIQFSDISNDQVTFKPESLVECPFESFNALTWSFDSSKIYYNKNGYKYSKSQLVAININDKSTQIILNNVPPDSNDYMPIAEPGGKRLAYVRYWLDKFQIRLFDTESKTDVMLKEFNNHEPLTDISWLYGQQALLIYSKEGLQILTLEGKLSSIQQGKIINLNQWNSNDQIKLVYTIEDYTSKVTEYKLPGTSDPALGEYHLGLTISDSSKSEYSGHYSSNGKAIIFVSDRETSDYRIWIKKNGKVELLDERAVGGSVRWSPDDKTILYSTENGQMAIFDIESEKTQVLFDIEQNIGKVILSQRKDIIYFSQVIEDEHQIFRKDLNNSTVTQLTNEGGYYMQEVNNGSLLYYNKYNRPGLWSLDQTTGSHQLVMTDFHAMNYSHWQAFDNGLYYIRNTNAARGLFFYDFESKQHKKLIDNKEFFHFDVSPDQSKILITEKKRLIGDLYTANLVSNP